MERRYYTTTLNILFVSALNPRSLFAAVTVILTSIITI
jgi:uncharacterized membrane protein